jgi:hypothetical protein
MLKPGLGFFILIFVLAACAPSEKDNKVTAAPTNPNPRSTLKTKPEPKVPSSPRVQNGLENSFGMDLKHRKSKDVSMEERDLSAAVALVEVGSRKGTGFFISADGLFVTSSQNISKESCNLQDCPGVKITRAFSVESKSQVFKKSKLIAANAEMDFALVQVDLGDIKSVPYLKTAKTHLFNKKSEKEPYLMIGHPFASSVGVSKAHFKRQESVLTASFDSVAMPGSQGSPLFSVDHEVIAMHKAEALNSDRAEKNGWVAHEGKSTPWETIAEGLSKSFPLANFESPRSSDFQIPADQIEEAFRPFQNLDQAIASALITKDLRVIAAWILGKENETESLKQLVQSFSKLRLKDQLTVNLVKEISTAVENLNYVPKPETLSWIESLAAKDSQSLTHAKLQFERVINRSSKESTQKCLTQLKPKKTIRLSLIDAVEICGAVQIEGRKVMETYKDRVESLVNNGKINESGEETFHNAVTVIEILNAKNQLDKVDKSSARKALQEIINHSSRVRTSYAAEGLLTKIQKDLR